MIKLTTDYPMIRKMLLEDKELFERISDDHTEKGKWDPEKSKWVGWFEDGECLGLLSVKHETSIVLNIHIHIPKKNRGEGSFMIGNGLLEYLIDNCDKRFVKINVKIPSCYPDVIRFAEKNGFEIEGTDRKSHIKDGEYFDRIMLGRII